MGPDRGQDTAKSLQEDKLPFHCGAEVMLSGSILKPCKIKQLISALFYCQLLKKSSSSQPKGREVPQLGPHLAACGASVEEELPEQDFRETNENMSFLEINKHVHIHREEKATTGKWWNHTFKKHVDVASGDTF